MSDSDAYSYEYDDNSDGNNDDNDNNDNNDNNDSNESEEEEAFEYTDDDDDDDRHKNGSKGPSIEIQLENSYYNGKSLRDNGDLDEAQAAFESVIATEVAMIRNRHGDCSDDNDVCMTSAEDPIRLLTPLKYHGAWSYKAIKQIIKLHLRFLSLDNWDSSVKGQSKGSVVEVSQALLQQYERMLRLASSPDAAISPNAVEKGVNGMLERVSTLVNNNSNNENYDNLGHGNIQNNHSAIYTKIIPTDYTFSLRSLAQKLYDLTLQAFHPSRGISPNERLWFKTNIKYGQLLYEMNETTKLQLVIKDLLERSGQQQQLLGAAERDFYTFNHNNNNNIGGTHTMEIAALQIQLYSRLKDTKRLKSAYHSAMSVRGGIPHPRTLALIQELGGKMHMSQRNFNDASQSFFQAFKSYDEAGDRSRLRCLKYLVMASMLHASTINPFDSHEARAHREDPEIVAMTNLVQAFHNNDIQQFEQILKKNQGRLMNDEFVREHVADLLRTIRTQVLLRTIGPYSRIRLERIAMDYLNGITVEEVESLLVSLILDGKLHGKIDSVKGIFVKAPFKTVSPNSEMKVDGKSNAITPSNIDGEHDLESKNIASMIQLTTALEHLTAVVSKVSASKSAQFQQVM